MNDGKNGVRFRLIAVDTGVLLVIFLCYEIDRSIEAPPDA
jgi:hypothetical protein